MTDMTEDGWHPTASLPSEWVVDIFTYLKTRPVFPGYHVKYLAGATTTWEAALGEHVLCWDMHDVILAPHLFDYVMTRAPYARQWLGSDTLLYSINAFCTRPGGPVRPDIQEFHEDKDDVKFIPLFIPLTDDVVQEVKVPDGRTVTIEASAGDAFFSNTMLPHRGLLPTSERIVIWARWGVSDPPAAYLWDKLTPIDKAQLGSLYPTDAAMQRMIHLVAA